MKIPASDLLKPNYLKVLSAALFESKLSQTEIAEKIGKSKQTVSAYFTGEHTKSETLEEICLTIGIPLKELIREDLQD